MLGNIRHSRELIRQLPSSCDGVVCYRDDGSQPRHKIFVNVVQRIMFQWNDPSEDVRFHPFGLVVPVSRPWKRPLKT